MTLPADLLRKLPSMLSSTCCSSDVEAVRTESVKQVEAYGARCERMAYARQELQEQTRARVLHHRGNLPDSMGLEAMTKLVLKRAKARGDRLSRQTVVKYLKQHLYNKY